MTYNLNRMKRPILSLLTLVCALSLMSCKTAHTFKVSSPDGQLQAVVKCDAKGALTYAFSADGDELVAPSALGFQLDSQVVTAPLVWRVENVSQREVRSEWKPLWGKRSVVPDCFNEMVIDFASDAVKMQLTVRSYDDGIAFRYHIPEMTSEQVKVERELTSYNFADDYTAWYYNGEMHNIGPERLSATDGRRRPVMTVQAGEQHFMAIHEADLIAGEPLLLRSKAGETAFTVASKPRVISPGYTSAWRVVMYGNEPGDLVDSHLIELLNPEPDTKYDFESWVKPGIALWDWRMNGAIWDDFRYTMSYPSWIRAVDFASEAGFRYLVLDANWYGPEFNSDSDPIKGDKASDVKKLIAYAKEKGVGIWLYLNDVGGRRFPIEETLKQYGEWGAAGVKYGFMTGSEEEKHQRTMMITRLCAENHLLVNYHDGPIHPFGQSRTWPNAVTREYCQAQLDAHRVFQPKTFVTSVFVNMVAGPVDMNNGMFDLRQGRTTRVDESQPVPSTLVAEAARTLITYSGVTIIPDIPEYYLKYPELLAFLSAQKMPWRESRTLAGEIGEYIVMMRETDEAYLIGVATNEESRTINVPLSFLGDGTYEAAIVEDGEGAHYLTHRETLKSSTKKVAANDAIQVTLAPGGGACVMIMKNHK